MLQGREADLQRTALFVHLLNCQYSVPDHMSDDHTRNNRAAVLLVKGLRLVRPGFWLDIEEVLAVQQAENLLLEVQVIRLRGR